MWLGGLLSVVPVLGIIGGLFGIYGLYLMYIGLPKLKNPAADKHTSYFVVSLLAMIAVYIVLWIVLERVLLSIFGLRVII